MNSSSKSDKNINITVIDILLKICNGNDTLFIKTFI